MDFEYKKKFGQNFISDTNLLKSILNNAEIKKEDEILEIGTGLGSLTKILSEYTKHVVSLEIDNSLKEYLKDVELLSNVKIIFGDCMRMDEKELAKEFNSFKIVANLPYYITTPIIFKFLPVKNLTEMVLMVQKEVAERICSKPNCKDYGVLSANIQVNCSVKIIKNVPASMFYPRPNVDSAVIQIIKNPLKLVPENYQETVRMAFLHRRKTLYNNMILAGFTKENAVYLLNKMNLPLNIRGETLSPDDFLNLANLINEANLIS